MHIVYSTPISAQFINFLPIFSFNLRFLLPLFGPGCIYASCITRIGRPCRQAMYSIFVHGQFKLLSDFAVCFFSTMIYQPGKLLPSAHAVDREYLVMKSLKDHGVPTPTLLGFCEDSRSLILPLY